MSSSSSCCETNGMARWKNRVALVTGASFGIGAAISKSLVQHGLTVIGCARNHAEIEKISQQCTISGYTGKLLARHCDVSNETEIEELLEWIETNHGGVDVCVNNAGFSVKEGLLDISGQQMWDMLNVNVVGLVWCTSKCLQSMKKRGINDGHIFHINSMLGHRIYGTLTFYAATKYAVTALTEGLRRELVAAGSRIRVTSISPGTVETEFAGRTWGENEGKAIYRQREGSKLQAHDIADSLLYALSAPENVQVHDILIRPTGEPLSTA